MPQYSQLSPEEEHIIIHKGTEAPGTGALLHEKRIGTFSCKRCHAPLYRSTDKFDSDCGWPSFDDAIPGTVKRTTDPDGNRTEITCASCGAHLGHVFVWEWMTEKNTRHCVNSLSMIFEPGEFEEAVLEQATLGGGCFRCVEAAFQQIKGVLDIKSGFSGGKRPFPSYEQVSVGTTGYIEVVHISYDPMIISYKQILEIFFSIHNPTQIDGQGNDIGDTYMSAIFYHNPTQQQIAQSVIDTLEQSKIRSDPIITQLRPFEKFRIADDYHQNFYRQHPNKPYCQIVIDPKISKLRKNRAHLLKD
jgi:peptide methionine sulfoxide reductase msrA/msrB